MTDGKAGFYPTAINGTGWGRCMEEFATGTQFKYTKIVHNDMEDGKAGEVRTKLLEKTLSEGSKR